MLPKILHRAGLIASILLVVACFMPWTFYADINQTFTGFYSYNNQYGRPGRFLSFVAVLSFALVYLPKVWAKRVNPFICAIALGYAFRTYVLFTSCYKAYCPEKKWGIYLMMACCIVMMIAAAFPDLKLGDKKVPEAQA